MNQSLFISVRTGSSRLPNKSILKINNRFTIEYLIERLKLVNRTSHIVMCTTELEEDDILCEIALKNKISFFRGSAEDKLQRWMGACDHFEVDSFVNADGDDIFYDAPLADLCLKQLSNSNVDFVDGSGLYNDIYGIRSSALKKVCEIKDTTETEFIKPYFVDSGIFNVEKLKNVPEIYHKTNIRMTLDYPEDLLFFKSVINSLEQDKQYLDFSKIVKFLIDNEDIININSHLDKEWKENQIKSTKLILKESI